MRRSMTKTKNILTKQFQPEIVHNAKLTEAFSDAVFIVFIFKFVIFCALCSSGLAC